MGERGTWLDHVSRWTKAVVGFQRLYQYMRRSYVGVEVCP